VTYLNSFKNSINSIYFKLVSIIIYTYSANQKSGDRVTKTVQFYVVIAYTFVSELGKIMM